MEKGGITRFPPDAGAVPDAAPPERARRAAASKDAATADLRDSESAEKSESENPASPLPPTGETGDSRSGRGDDRLLALALAALAAVRAVEGEGDEKMTLVPAALVETVMEGDAAPFNVVIGDVRATVPALADAAATGDATPRRGDVDASAVIRRGEGTPLVAADVETTPPPFFSRREAPTRGLDDVRGKSLETPKGRAGCSAPPPVGTTDAAAGV